MKRTPLYLISLVGVFFLITQPAQAALEEATTTLANYTAASIEGQWLMLFMGAFLGGLFSIIIRFKGL